MSFSIISLLFKDDVDFLKERMKAEEYMLRSMGKSMGKGDERTYSPNKTSPKKKSSPSTVEMQKLFECFLKTMGGATTSESQPDETMASFYFYYIDVSLVRITWPASQVNFTLQVKVGKALSLPKSVFMEAKIARTPSIMAVDLVKASFSLKRLKRSTYAGQRRTRNGEVVQKPSLKKYQKMKDIQGKFCLMLYSFIYFIYWYMFKNTFYFHGFRFCASAFSAFFTVFIQPCG